MTTIPATALGEVRLDLNDLGLNGTDVAVGGYAYLWPNLTPGTIYRASNVDPLVAKKTRVTFTTAGLLQDPATGAYPKVLASDAPGATFAGMQWVLGDFNLTNRTRLEQPADRYFEVPAESFVNVGLLTDPAEQPSVQTIYLDSAPILTELNTTDTAVEALFSSPSLTRDTADARYSPASEADTRASADTALDARLDTIEANTGWIDVAYASGFAAGTGGQLQYRVVGKTAYWRGGATGTFVSGAYTQVTASPVASTLWPNNGGQPLRGGAMGTAMRACGFEVGIDGHIRLGANLTSMPTWIAFETSYPINPL